MVAKEVKKIKTVYNKSRKKNPGQMSDELI